MRMTDFYSRIDRIVGAPLALRRNCACVLVCLVHLMLPGTGWSQARVLEAMPPAQAVESWSVADVESWAEQNSPLLPQAAAEVQVQRGRARQAGLLPNPELQGGSPQLGGRDSQYYAMLSQEIVTKHKLQLDQAAICREVFQAEFRFVRTRFELLTAVRQSFYAALAAQRRLEANERLLVVARRSAGVAARLEASGEGARSDTLLLEVELERSQFGLSNAQANLEAAKRQLAATMGDPNLGLSHLDGNLTDPLPDYPFELTQAGILTRNANVHVAQLEIERSEILLQRAVVQPFPNLTVGGGYMYQVMAPHNMGMVQVSLPLPLWNKNQGAIQAAQSSVVRASHAARQTELDLTRQLAAATGRFDVARQQVERYEKSILPKANESVRLMQRAFEQGQFDLMRVLQSQRALIESELNYLTAQEARWNAAAEISGLLQEDEFPAGQ